MLIGPIVVLTLRILVPLLIFRRPLLGAIAALIIDALDVVILDVINLGHFSNYHELDKYLDIYYLGIEFFVSLKWTNLISRNTGIFLFVFRLVGVILFEITKLRILLFIFPNLFENFFIFVLVYKKFFKREIRNVRELLIILTVLLIPKMVQEYILHFAEAKPWNFIKESFLGIKS